MYGTQKNNQAIMKKAGSETTEGYIMRISNTICGKHVHGTKGQKAGKGGYGGGLAGGMLDKYLRAKEKCEAAKRAYNAQVILCKTKVSASNVKRATCNQYQGLMDANSCKNAVMVKDVCEAYATCYSAKKDAYLTARTKAKSDEKDRKAEWRGVKRMKCFIGAFGDGKVTAKEVDTCKGQTISTKTLEPQVSTSSRT
jgi:hypothetical protein